jgi:hypothetical protein
MFGLHVTDATVMNAAEAVKYGFIAWGLLAASMAIIFVVVLVLIKASNKKKDK